MIRKAVEWLLIAAVLVGGVFAWLTGRERARLGAEYARLVKSAGDLTITDPDKIHILALDTGEPLHYAWRVYLPPKHKLRMDSASGGSRGSHVFSGGRGEFIARARLRVESGRGVVQVYRGIEYGSGTFSISNRKLTDLLAGHEREILAEQLGSGKVAVLDPDETSVLLRLRLPEGLEAKAQETFDPAELNQFVPELFYWDIGPDPPRVKPKPPSSGR